MSIVNKLVEGGHLTPDQVERIGASVHEFMKEADANPEFVSEFLEKTGKLPWKEMGLMAGIGLGTTAASTLGSAGYEAVRGMIDDRKKAKRYKTMIENNPELRGRGVNAKMVQMHFNTLHRFNSEYADDPLVAGAYVQNQLEATRPNIESLNNIVQARKNRVESIKPSQAPSQALAPMQQMATQMVMQSIEPKPPEVPEVPRSVAALRRVAEVEKLRAQITPKDKSEAGSFQNLHPTYQTVVEKARAQALKREY